MALLRSGRVVTLVFGVLVLALGACAQLIRTQNSSVVLEVAGATLTLAPAGSCASATGDAANNLLLQNDLQAALVAGIAAASNTQFSTQISAVATTASGATAQLVSLSTANTALNNAIDTRVSTLTSSLSAVSSNTAQLSTRATQIASSIDQQTSTSLMALGAFLAAQLGNTQTQLSSQVQAEAVRASTAEAALSATLATQASQTLATASGFISTMFAQLQEETSALRADNINLRQQLLTETSRATMAELVTAASVAAGAVYADGNIASAQNRQFLNFSSGISTEMSRAVGVETTLNSSLLSSVSTASATASVGRVSVGNTVSSALAVEVSRATFAEQGLGTLILGLGASFNTMPTVTGTLWAWHDGNDINGNGVAPTIQTNLGTWFDKGPNAINMDTRFAGTAADVYFVPNAKNGRGAVFFNGNGVYTSSKVSTALGSSITWFVVYRTSTLTTPTSLATMLPDNAPWINWYMATGGTSERWEVGSGPITNTFTAGMTANTWVVSVGRSSPTLGLAHRNSFGSNDFSSSTGVPMAASSRGLKFAQYSGSNHNNFFAESIVFNSYLSTTDTNTIFTWLRGKWGI